MACRWSQLSAAVLLFWALPALGSMSVRHSPENGRTIDVSIVNERLSDAVGAVQIYLPKPVALIAGDDPVITVRAKDVQPEAALRALATAARATLSSEDERYVVRGVGEPGVTIDVKDAEVREILKTMQQQCGIRNLIVDPGVQGSGTFLFNRVPCRQAFRVVLTSLGLSAQTYSNSLVSVGGSPH